MESGNAMFYDLGNGDRFGDGFTKRRKCHSLLVLGIEFFKDLVDKDAGLNVPVDTDNAIRDSLTFGAHLAVLLHLCLIGSVCLSTSCTLSLHNFSIIIQSNLIFYQ